MVGTPADRVCPTCGAVNENDAEFCSLCLASIDDPSSMGPKPAQLKVSRQRVGPWRAVERPEYARRGRVYAWLLVGTVCAVAVVAAAVLLLTNARVPEALLPSPDPLALNDRSLPAETPNRTPEFSPTPGAYTRNWETPAQGLARASKLDVKPRDPVTVTRQILTVSGSGPPEAPGKAVEGKLSPTFEAKTGKLVLTYTLTSHLGATSKERPAFFVYVVQESPRRLSGSTTIEHYAGRYVRRVNVPKGRYHLHIHATDCSWTVRLGEE